MEKRGLISLRGVLLRYLVQTVFCCVLALLAALRLGSGVEGSWNEALWNWSPVPWLFRSTT